MRVTAANMPPKGKTRETNTETHEKTRKVAVLLFGEEKKNNKEKEPKRK